jgi:two-component sensor histidine kinase
MMEIVMASQTIIENKSEVTPLLFLEEFSHRVINQYATAAASIRLAQRQIASPAARSALDAAADRLGDYAEAHRALLVPVEHTAIDLADYLERLCFALTAAHLKERGITLSLSAESIVLDASRCWRAALIISELVTNAGRHALDGGGTILVIVQRLGDTIVCRVVDNGGVSRQPVPGRGTLVVRALAEDLDGDVRWTFGAHGSRAELSFPQTTQHAHEYIPGC